MQNQEYDSTDRPGKVRRRTVMMGAAWSVPAVVAVAPTPAFAASPSPCDTIELNPSTGGGQTSESAGLENYQFTVPAGVTSLGYVLAGGAGGMTNSVDGFIHGGAGAVISGTITVTPGETLTIFVGQGGGHRTGTASSSLSSIVGGGGYRKGGDADNTTSGATPYSGAIKGWSGASGGGASAILRGSTVLVAAAGGGGAGGFQYYYFGSYTFTYTDGGEGGDAGADGADNWYSIYNPGTINKITSAGGDATGAGGVGGTTPLGADTWNNHGWKNGADASSGNGGDGAQSFSTITNASGGGDTRVVAGGGGGGGGYSPSGSYGGGGGGGAALFARWYESSNNPRVGSVFGAGGAGGQSYINTGAGVFGTETEGVRAAASSTTRIPGYATLTWGDC